MNLHEAVERVPEPWRVEFLKFVETGQASEDFLRFLDQDTDCQEAVDAIFERQARVLEDLADGLHATDPVHAAREALATPAPELTVPQVTNDLARALGQTIVMTAPERRTVVENAVAAVEQAAPEGTGEDVRRTVSELADYVR